MTKPIAMRTQPVISMALLLCGLSLPSVFADSVGIAPSYTKTTHDGKFLLVMLSGEPAASDSFWDNLGETESRRFRSRYARSGLYRNDGSGKALWTMDWFAVEVEPLSDGIHLVRHGPWAQSADDEAISFFANGRLLKSYSISDLVSYPELMPHSVSHFEWESTRRFMAPTNQYEIRTKHGEHYVFDVTTGNIAQQSRLKYPLLAAIMFVLPQWMGVIAFTAIMSIAVYWVREKNQRRLRGEKAGENAKVG